MKISIIISVYNEQDVLHKFYSAFQNISKDFPWEYELLFVNDGSNDASLQILYEISRKDSNIKVISFSRNYGHEAAMIAGIDYAKGDVIICMDADLQHPLECIFPIVEKMNEGYEVINMVRVSNKSAGLLKNITSRGFYYVINKLSSQMHFEENASDFFAISKRVADILRNNYREKSRFLRGYVQNVGFKKTTLEYVAAERVGGKSHYNIKKLIRFSLSTIICFSDAPLKLGVYTGIASAFLGLVLLVYTLLTYQGSPSGYATIVIMLCFLFAMLFFVIGIIGEYLAVLFSEIKDRPIYLVEEKINFDEISADDVENGVPDDGR